MGGLAGKMKITFWVYLVGALALAGVFPLAGFWSKDEILADAFHVGFAEGAWHGTAVYLLLTVAAFFTAFYMGRQVFMVFFGEGRSAAAKHASESRKAMTIPLIILAILAAVGGFMNFPKIGELEFALTDAFGRWLEHTNETFHSLALNPTVALGSTVLALAALALAWLIYGREAMAAGEPDPLEAAGGLFTFLNRKWYVDELYDLLIVRPYVRLAWFAAEVLDGRFWHDWFHDTIIARGFHALTEVLSQGVDVGFIDTLANGLADFTTGAARWLGRLQTGYVRNYALSVLVGVVAILAYLLLR